MPTPPACAPQYRGGDPDLQTPRQGPGTGEGGRRRSPGSVRGLVGRDRHPEVTRERQEDSVAGRRRRRKDSRHWGLAEDTARKLSGEAAAGGPVGPLRAWGVVAGSDGPETGTQEAAVTRDTPGAMAGWRAGACGRPREEPHTRE